eukprot:CCRYP_001462-RA/>CCRYP_001462-RA protein AED:0.34 eAED:0.34 QI:417/1/1/1/1/1/2/123/388
MPRPFHHSITTTLALLALSTGKTTAFLSIAPRTIRLSSSSCSTTSTRIFLSAPDDDTADEEILRLRSLAAKLRAEAAELEAEKAQQMADAAERAFRKFDLNEDGEVSLEELKVGLEKELKTEISANRVAELMRIFDTSGDGALQLSEMPPLEKFRNTLESLVREEKRLAEEAKKELQKEKEAQLLAMAKLEFLNEKEPTMGERVVSILPYLFPLMDGLQYGRFLLSSSDDSNPFIIILAVLYSLYRSIPFSGFVAFFALNFLSGNPSLNRLIRFNMQQAIFIDIALFFPSLIIGLGGLIAGGAASAITQTAGELFSDVMFGSLLLVLLYCSGSSLLGREPDGIPLISDAVKDRMPTIDMFDNEGRFVPRELRGKDQEEEKKKDNDKDT